MQFRTYSAWDELPAGYDALFARAGAQDVCLGRAWFEALAASTLDAEERLVLAGVEADDRPSVACLVGRHRERDPAFYGARSFSSLSNYYTLRYAPIVDGDDGRAALPALIRGLRARRPRYAVLHLEPLAADAALSDDLAQALGAAGLVTRRYARSGNWHDDTRGLSFRDYLARRPAVLRNTFRRKNRAPGAGGSGAHGHRPGRRRPRAGAGSIRAGVRRELEAGRALPRLHPAPRDRPRRDGGAAPRPPAPRRAPDRRAALDRRVTGRSCTSSPTTEAAMASPRARC